MAPVDALTAKALPALPATIAKASGKLCESDALTVPITVPAVAFSYTQKADAETSGGLFNVVAVELGVVVTVTEPLVDGELVGEIVALIDGEVVAVTVLETLVEGELVGVGELVGDVVALSDGLVVVVTVPEPLGVGVIVSDAVALIEALADADAEILAVDEPVAIGEAEVALEGDAAGDALATEDAERAGEPD